MNARRHFGTELNLNNPVKGSLRLHKYKGKCLPQKRTLIQANNISVNSFQFSSHLKFPVDPQIELFFRIQLLGQTFELYGVIVRRKQLGNHTYQYGVQLHKTQIGYIKSVLCLTGELNDKSLLGNKEVS